MSHVSELLSSVETITKYYGIKYPRHQKLTYAIEQVVAKALPSRTTDLWGARDFVKDVCLGVGADIPDVVRGKIGKGFSATASKEHGVITLGSSVTSTLTLCHELAHILVSENVGHHKEWRDQFVYLTRHAVSVEHGALLHTLYTRSGLPTDWK